MGSCGSQGPPGAVAPAFPHPGDQAAYCSGLGAHSRPPGACPCAQGDPPSSWPCPGSLALCLPSPGPEGLVPARHPSPPLWVRCLRFQLFARDASSVTLSPHVFLVPTPGVPQIPAPGRQRFSPTSGALPVLALDPPWLALLPFPPHQVLSQSRPSSRARISHPGARTALECAFRLVPGFGFQAGGLLVLVVSAGCCLILLDHCMCS